MHNRYCAYLVGTPDEYLKLGHPERYEQQKPDAITAETVEYIKNQPLIKAILAGHVHTDFESYITETIPQYITGMITIRQINVE